MGCVGGVWWWCMGGRYRVAVRERGEGRGERDVGSRKWEVGSGVLLRMDFSFTVKISNSKELYIWNTASFRARVR